MSYTTKKRIRLLKTEVCKIMDNNQNFGQQPQQPVNNMNVQPQQQPNNAFVQQPMNNNMYQQQFMQQPPKQPTFNLFELISIICSGVGFLMVFFGTIFSCTCSTSENYLKNSDGFGVHPIFVLTLVGIVVAIAGIVLAIMALKQVNVAIKAGKISKVSIVLGIAAVVFGLLPLITMCGYTCSLNNTIGL